ncbi:DapH/DapD/GlmU-related protein, partial [uncultured Duncaniella sp.]
DETNIPPASRPLWSKGKVIIEDSVWIGDKATILPNVTLGKGCIIGANSVVTKDIPPYAIACGNPAKVIRYIN